MTTEIKPSLQDFSLLSTYVKQIEKDKGVKSVSAFYYFVLDMLLNLQDDEIDEAVTDANFLFEKGKESGHDRGMDAVYIDEAENPPTVHLFNFKYTEKFEKTKGFFPSQEIDKIVGFISNLISQSEVLTKNINPLLREKVQEIWELFKTQNPNFIVHICSNLYNSFEITERQRFEKEIARFSNFEIKYHSMPDFVKFITKKEKVPVNAKLQVIDQNLFEKSDGDVRALIVDIDARDLLRVVIDSEELRNNPHLDNYNILTEHKINDQVFDDNVRIYLKQRSKINRNIKETALSDDNFRFFYFNNGITLTCTDFKYQKNRRNPIVEIANFQVVNGCQTVNALFEAFKTKPEIFKSVDLLCRIYETRNEALSVDIAECTNSQNPVTSRDIRANDFIQKKLEKELAANGWYYERKKRQHHGKSKSRRMDAEKVGQALMAFFNGMPGEAKDKKRLIFSEKYEEVFSDDITADSLILAFSLFSKIEEKRIQTREKLLKDPERYQKDVFILHATYYILYVFSKLAEINKVSPSASQIETIFKYYDVAVDLIQKSIKNELKTGADYNHRKFFKGNKPKKHLSELLEKAARK